MNKLIIILLIILGGLLIIANGAITASIGYGVYSSFNNLNNTQRNNLNITGLPSPELVTGFVTVIGAVSIISGLLILISGILMYFKPGKTKLLSIIVIIFSFPSLIVGGGFLIGFALSLIGGIIGLLNKPELAKK
jgi:hypothetical protein